jgi:hypothetical protein
VLTLVSCSIPMCYPPCANQHHSPLALPAQRLTTLQALLEQQEPQGLLACWDYVSLPLLLVVDSTVQARMPSPSRVGAAADAGQEEQVAGHLDVPVPAAASDRVSEAALSESHVTVSFHSCSNNIHWRGCHLRRFAVSMPVTYKLI